MADAPSPAARGQRVFLCHSSSDKPAVRALYRRLRTDGFQPWLDEEDLLPGQTWEYEIQQAVRSADVVLVCLSSRSVNKAGFVQKEIKFALDVADQKPEGEIFLIPVKLETCEIPERLRRWQWVDYFDAQGHNRLLGALRVRFGCLGAEERSGPLIGPIVTEGIEPVSPRVVSDQPVPICEPVRASLVLPKPGDVRINPADKLPYVWIPPGTFTMGCSPGDELWNSPDLEPAPPGSGFRPPRPSTPNAWVYRQDEEAIIAHRVILTKGFWIGQTQVTQEAYERVIGRSPSRFRGEQRPVEQVSWEEARLYCAKVGMRLPTEAEWEYAARAGSTRARYGPIYQTAWYSGNSRGLTHNVGTKLPNAWGLYDMLGNVYEWCSDWYSVDGVGEPENPSGPVHGEDKVIRGGSCTEDQRVTLHWREGISGTARPCGQEHDRGLLLVGFRCAGELG